MAQMAGTEQIMRIKRAKDKAKSAILSQLYLFSLKNQQFGLAGAWGLCYGQRHHGI